MSRTITLEVPDEVFASLTAEAAASGKSVVQVAADRLAPPPPAVKPGDRLRAIRGIITHGPGDLSARMDEYLGRGYLETHDPEGGR